MSLLLIKEDIKVRMAAKIVLSLVLVLAAQQVFAQHKAASLRMDPPEIPVNLFYGGTQVRVSGVSPAGEDLYLLCTGEASTVELREKERIWGFLWVNGEDISFKNVPSLYQLASSGKGTNPSSPDLIRAGLGFSGLESQIIPGTGDERQHRCYSELIKLKKRERLYSVRDGALEIQPLGDEWQEFSSSFYFPPAAGPGTYRFRLMTIVKGRAVELANGTISVRLVGTTAFIRSLSKEHGLLYGVLAVVVALLVGLLTGMIFSRRSRSFGH
jgi:hypothetical protein